ncbi:MAG: prephenate dehydratase [bacterium]
MKMNELRKRIDQIDGKILEMLEERISIAKEIGKLKREENLSLLHIDREREVLERLIKNRKLLSKEAISAIYREIFSVSLHLQGEPTIAYLGPAGTFTHQAAEQRFGASNKYIGFNEISDVFMEVLKKGADYGVVPIENSIEGIVSNTLDMFISSDVVICDEIYLKISHCLLSKEDSILKIKRVYSHPSAFAQCRKFLSENMPGVELIDMSSTASAAKRVVDEKCSAAIGNKWAGEIYCLNILKGQIEDFVSNTTRFVVIGREYGNATGQDKTSILFSVKDRPGALHDMLMPFAEEGINLTKIESRPSKIKPWEYMFFIDFEGHIQDEKVKIAIEGLNNLCNYLKVLGSYPKGEMV